MAMSASEAKLLQPGDKLTFGTQDYLFEVVEIIDKGPGVHLVLLRDDGYQTFATHKDLDVANVHTLTERKPPEPPEGEKPEGEDELIKIGESEAEDEQAIQVLTEEGGPTETDGQFVDPPSEGNLVDQIKERLEAQQRERDDRGRFKKLIE